MSEPDDAVYAAHWWSLAMGDLVSSTAMAAAASSPPRHAAWLAHQAAEKALKAAIAASGAEPPRTHDLVTLAARLTGPASVGAPTAALRRLSDAQIWLRYPEVLEPPIRWPEVHDLIADATEIVEQARASLQRQGLSTDGLEPA